MTLEPTDKEHEAQIKAGIEGRKKVMILRKP